MSHSDHSVHHHKQHASCHPKSERDETEALNDILLAKRRAELLRERRILWVITILCCIASVVSKIIFIDFGYV